MKISSERYSFEIPDKWKEMVGAKTKGNRTDIVLLWDEEYGCSGLMVSLRCLKRKKNAPDEYTELIGTLTGESGGKWFLYAVYGQEGAVSEANEDLYWRLRDQLWKVFESIRPNDGYSFNGA